jgi:hypothetical protein
VPWVTSRAREHGGFAKYQQKTDRELPIIRLAPRSAPESG